MANKFFNNLLGSGGGVVTPIALLASTKVGYLVGDVGGTTTPAIDTTGATLLIAVVSNLAGSAAASLSDSKGNTWVSLTAQATATVRSQIFYVKNPTVGSGHTFTVSGLGTGSPGMCVAAFNNTDTTANADQQNGATSASASVLATGNVTPTSNNQLIITALAGLKPSATINGGFTIVDGLPFRNDGVGVNIQVVLAYLVQDASTSANPSWDTSTAGSIAATIATFKHG